MKRIKGVLLVGTFFAVAVLAILATQGLSQAADATLVNIQPKGGDTVTGFQVDPETVTVTKNAILVWMSSVPGIEIQVIFNEGKTCRDVTSITDQKNPGFYMDAKNCYVTNFLSYCATSTLQFPEAGSFEYKVVNEDGKMQAKGVIIVK
jgi:hypothetical protein